MPDTDTGADETPRPPTSSLVMPRPVVPCKTCRAPMIWAETKAKEGKPSRGIPLDADPDNHGWPRQVADGNLVLTGDVNHRGTPIVDYRPKGVGKYVTHFATCPNPKSHRKTR